MSEPPHPEEEESDPPLFESDFARGVLAPRPLAPGHVVIECRGEWKGIEDFAFRASNEVLAGFFRSVVQAAQSLGLSEVGYRLLVEEGAVPATGRFVVNLVPGRGELSAPAAASAAAEEQEVPADLRTLVLPPQGTPTEEQVAALSSALGGSPAAAGAVFASPLPRALARRPRQELVPIERRLREAGVATRLVTTRLLLQPFRPWLVERIERTGQRAGDDLRVHGPEGEALLTFDRNALLVVGRYSWLAEGRGTSRSGWSTTRLQTMRHTRFAHLWFARGERAYSFVESALTGYEFLGEAKQPSALANFDALVELLDDQPRVVGCYELMEHPLLVKSVADTYLNGLPRPATTSPDAAADLLSRVYFQLTLGDAEGPAPAANAAAAAHLPDPPPDTLETWIGLGEHYARLGDLEAARTAFEAALRKQPDSPQALVALSRIRPEPRQSLRDLSRALQVAPGHVEALCERGQVLVRLGETQPALGDFMKAVDLRPEHPGGWRGLAAVYLARGDREAAITAFSAAIQADPADPRAWFRRGVLRLERSETELGLADLIEARRLDPGLAAAAGPVAT